MNYGHPRAACLALLLLCAAPALAADAVLYRIFLRDGSTMVSYGDYARVGDRVVISVPIGTGNQPQLQLVTIAESNVDWQLTERYADAARAKHYAATRGEDDFNLLSNEVARALNEVALTTDPAKRVALADYARQQLAEWPAAHFGYRAADVAQLSALLDEVVSELRVAAGQSRFDLKLIAAAIAPPAMDVFPAPSLRESIELAFTAARVAAEPAERVSLLESIGRTLASATPAAAAPDGTSGARRQLGRYGEGARHLRARGGAGGRSCVRRAHIAHAGTGVRPRAARRRSCLGYARSKRPDRGCEAGARSTQRSQRAADRDRCAEGCGTAFATGARRLDAALRGVSRLSEEARGTTRSTETDARLARRRPGARRAVAEGHPTARATGGHVRA